MRHVRLTFAAVLVPMLFATAVLAQTPGATEPETTTPAPAAPAAPAAEEPKAAAPSTAPATTEAPALSAKDLEGLAVFGSDGKQIGNVTKVTESDGKVTGVEVTSPGFFGFMATTYSVPADKLSTKDGRVDLSMTSGEAAKLAK
jgi:sporulation protein YlmC with PRC-barrel domain